MNRPIISLVDAFGVSCVAERGRVSLAHLIEFSSFVDLYVLEDSIYLDASAVDVFLQPFVGQPDTPLCRLPQSALSDAVDRVSVNTLRVYDEAPVKHTFALGSYDYWIKLSEMDREKAIAALPRRVERFDRTHHLLSASREIEAGVRKTLELIGSTQYTVMPSARNVIPFLEAFNQMETPALKLYNAFAGAHKKRLDPLLQLTRPREVYLPPLLGLLLSRCASRGEIPDRLTELRAEFAALRSEMRAWLERLDNTSSLKEKLELTDELTAAAAAASRLFEDKRPTFYREVVGAFMEGALDADPIRMVTKPALSIVKKGMEQVVPDMLSTRRYTGFIDLLDATLKIDGYAPHLERLFGADLDVSQAELSEARAFQKLLGARYSIVPPSPA